MTSSDPMHPMHPVDRLHDIRDEIATLRLEARTIRERIQMGETGTKGERWQVSQQTHFVLQAVPQAVPCRDVLTSSLNQSPLQNQAALNQPSPLHDLRNYQNYYNK